MNVPPHNYPYPPCYHAWPFCVSDKHQTNSGMDPVTRRKLWNMLLAKKETSAILLTTHFMEGFALDHPFTITMID